MTRTLALIAALGLVAGLASCGKRGAPVPPSQVKDKPAAAAPAN